MLQKTNMIDSVIEDAIVQNIIVPDSKKETLETVYYPYSSYEALKFFKFLQSHVLLTSNGMGVDTKESRYGIAMLLEKDGFEYELYQDFIELYENMLYKQYNNSQEKKDK